MILFRIKKGKYFFLYNPAKILVLLKDDGIFEVHSSAMIWYCLQNCVQNLNVFQNQNIVINKRKFMVGTVIKYPI